MQAGDGLSVGDVVQLDPKKHLEGDGFFAGCFMLVTELRSWGAQGVIFMPGHRGSPPGRAYYRARWDEMERIGKAAWTPFNEMVAG